MGQRWVRSPRGGLYEEAEEATALVTVKGYYSDPEMIPLYPNVTTFEETYLDQLKKQALAKLTEKEKKVLGLL